MVLLFVIIACGSSTEPAPSVQTDTRAIFIAVHNEPVDATADGFAILNTIVGAADQNGVRLTLMFTPQWAEMIVADPGMSEKVASWQAEGHEIAAHHHGLTHPSWDGYSFMPEIPALFRRAELGYAGEEFKGGLDDLMSLVRELNPSLNSGCMNEESDHGDLPDDIIYSTCSGYANYGDPPMPSQDTNIDKAVNDFIVTDGQHKWLSHSMISSSLEVDVTVAIRKQAEGTVLGFIFHSTEAEKDRGIVLMQAVMDSGRATKTVSEVMQSGLLGEVQIDW